VPTFDGGDDVVGVRGPDERLGLPVVLGEVAVDGGLEMDDGMKDATLEAALRQFGEETFDGVEPRAGGRREVEGEAMIVAWHLGVRLRDFSRRWAFWFETEARPSLKLTVNVRLDLRIPFRARPRFR
jgi:hypothetical protein